MVQTEDQQEAKVESSRTEREAAARSEKNFSQCILAYIGPTHKDKLECCRTLLD